MSKENIDKKSYNSIDLAKFIGALFVIAIHTDIFSSVSKSSNFVFTGLISRLAVYFFFIASSFFFFRTLEYENVKIKKTKNNIRILKKYMIRMCTLYIFWSGVYFIVFVIRGVQEGWISSGELVGYWINSAIDKSWYHMWFVISLIYAIPIMYFLLIRIKIKSVIILSMLMYCVGII